MSALTYNLRITTIVSRRWGGCIFNGAFIDAGSGLVTETGAYANVKVSPAVLGGFVPQVGMWVAVQGESSVEKRQFDDIVRNAHIITAKGFTYLRPSGEHLIRFLADSDEFAGIGIARARRLWDTFGDDLYRILDEGECSALLELLPSDVAANLVRAWAEIASSDVVRWLHDSNFPFPLARKVVKHFGKLARVSIEEDPYRLLSFNASWKVTDSFARAQFGVKPDDPRRLLAACEEALLPCRLLALAGRAAKRISEATGRPAQTIAGFIRNADVEELERGIVVIDEASMVDIVSMAQVLDLIPATCRIVLVGDSAQLMPVGPGLVFHVLCGALVPTVELKVARRFGTQIASFADQIRDGAFPSILEDSTAPVCLFDLSRPDAIAETIVELYDPADCQVLCSRRSGHGGTEPLNSLLQARVNPKGQRLMVLNREFDRPSDTGLRLNDHVIYTRNNYKLDLRNGSLGKLSGIPEEPTIYCDEAGEPLGTVIAWVEWDDGVLRPVFEDMLSDIELAYAITTHKAQGSQWRRVLIPLVKARNFDRSMLYTAVTRAQSQVILIGDRGVAVDAANGLPHSRKRRIHLGEYIISAANSLPTAALPG